MRIEVPDTTKAMALLVCENDEETTVLEGLWQCGLVKICFNYVGDNAMLGLKLKISPRSMGISRQMAEIESAGKEG